MTEEKIELNDFEKRVFNSFLYSLRKAQNKPFNKCKKFNFDNQKLLTIKRVAGVIESTKVDIEKYFQAPYELRVKDDIYPLSFFYTLKALKLYRLYLDKLNRQDPDNEYHLRKLIESFNFILSYCKTKHISLMEYGKYYDGSIPAFINHLKGDKITYYTIVALQHHGVTFEKITAHLSHFLFGEARFTLKLDENRARYYKSTKMKNIGKKLCEATENKLKSLNQ